MQIKLPLTIKLIKDEHSKSAPWVAYTPELDVSSCGPTVARAKRNLEEAVRIVLEGAAEDGNLKELLLDSGFEIKRLKIYPPKIKIGKLTFNLQSQLTSQLWLA